MRKGENKMKTFDLSGKWQCEVQGRLYPAQLPGTLDENRIGFPDKNRNAWHPDAQGNATLDAASVIATRYTRKYTYEGPAVYSRRVQTEIPAGSRVFFECERSRRLSFRVNGTLAADFDDQSLSAPHVLEVTGLLRGDDLFEVTVDNSYPGWPRDEIFYSSAATDETQTNWNGLLGYLRLRVEKETFIERVRVYPHGGMADVCVTLSTEKGWSGKLTLESDAFACAQAVHADAARGTKEIWARDLSLRADIHRWDEDDGFLYELRASGEGLDARRVSFGVRDFGDNGRGRLALNGRVIFLRSEANCAVFPETGYGPMDVDAWLHALRTYRAYGVNCMRFHSHTPPEAAFEAADRLGMMMQPELSHWNPHTAFESDESYACYAQELRQTLLTLANHPSFVMLTFGNELVTSEKGMERMHELLRFARQADPTRLYANGSNTFYGQRGCDGESDFYTSSSFREQDLRATFSEMQGVLNHEPANAKFDYSAVMAQLRQEYKKPVFSFEVGQYEVLPDFDEIDAFHGVTRPDNLALIRDRAKEAGLEGEWKRRVEATGELSRLCYRAEIEAVMRTEEMSGISLLGLQDFPGQGTALVGMLNSHLQPKPYDFARPERFRAFFDGVLPLALLPRYCYETGETLEAEIRVANYGRRPLRGALRYTLICGITRLAGELAGEGAPCGALTRLGTIRIALPEAETAHRFMLQLEMDGVKNAYPVWVYPRVKPRRPETVWETEHFDAQAERVLEAGGVVYLSPAATKEALPQSIGTQFSTDFWSVGTFPKQEGGMGQLIESGHPVFEGFPTDSHTDWQWWHMAGQRALIVPAGLKAIVTEMDSYAYMRPMAQLFEARCGSGRVLVSSFGLQNLQQYPEARALLGSIYGYLASDAFAPCQRVEPELLRALVP